MKMINKLLLLIMVVSIFAILLPVSAGAVGLDDGINCADLNSTERPPAVCNTLATDPISGPGGLLANIANIVAYVAGAAAIIFIVIAGIRFITSGGDPGNVKRARDSIIYALIGIVIVLLSRVIIYFVLNIYN